MTDSVVTVTGKYLRNNRPAVGKVFFIPTVNTVTDNSGSVLNFGPYEVLLDAVGAFSIDLPATDSPDLNPSDFGYRVVCDFREGVVPEIIISLPVGLGSLDVTGQYPLPTYDGWSPIVKAGLAVGTVTTVPYGEPASINITGEFPDQVINMVIPRGAPGLGNYSIDPDNPDVLVIEPGDNEHVDPDNSSVLVVTT